MTTKQEVALRDKRYLVADVAMQPGAGSYSYQAALEATGVKVLAYEQFGSYQGDWWAWLEFPNHERFFVNGSYGSCSGCDAFEAEFGWKVSEDDPSYLHKLRDFGLDYLTDCRTPEQALDEAGKDAAWDVEAGEVMAWIRKVSANG